MFALTLVSTVGLAVVMAPGAAMEGVVSAIGRIPRVGPPLKSLLDAVRMYRTKPGVLVLSSVMTVGVHCSVRRRLLPHRLPGCRAIISRWPSISWSCRLSAAMQVIPLPIGPTEVMLELLYRYTPVGPAIAEGQGLVVALVYRLISMLIAVLGVLYYFGNRREMAEVMHEAEEET